MSETAPFPNPNEYSKRFLHENQIINAKYACVSLTKNRILKYILKIRKAEAERYKNIIKE